MDSAVDFYSSRLTKKERATTILDELVKDVENRKYFKKKFLEVQEKKGSGGKKWFKNNNQARKPSYLRK